MKLNLQLDIQFERIQELKEENLRFKQQNIQLEKKEEERINKKVEERLRREKKGCKARCQSCKAMVRSDEVLSYKTGEKLEVKPNLNCNSEMVIYLIECHRCPWRYVGSAKKGMRERSQGHRSEAKGKIGALSHFNSGGCTLEDYTITILDQLRHNQTENEMKKLLKLEGIWMMKIPECINRRLEEEEI